MKQLAKAYFWYLLIGLCSLVLVLSFALFKLVSERSKCNLDPVLGTVAVTSGQGGVQAEVASEGADMVKGLSDRECLPEGAGMLFTYDLTGDYCFWMKDMQFPIDMIWLDEEKKIVTIKGSVSPDTYPQSFCPDKPAQYVLEVNAGVADDYGWAVGSILSF